MFTVYTGRTRTGQSLCCTIYNNLQKSTDLQIYRNVPRSQSLFYIVSQGSLSTPSPDNIMCNKWGRERGADEAASHPSVGFPSTYSPHSLLGQSSNPCCDTTEQQGDQRWIFSNFQNDHCAWGIVGLYMKVYRFTCSCHFAILYVILHHQHITPSSSSTPASSPLFQFSKPPWP